MLQDAGGSMPVMDAIGWLILVIVVLVVVALVFLFTRRRRRKGGVLATRGKR
jgi:LPXTG-motif cell wall-anchored protein